MGLGGRHIRPTKDAGGVAEPAGIHSLPVRQVSPMPGTFGLTVGTDRHDVGFTVVTIDELGAVVEPHGPGRVTVRVGTWGRGEREAEREGERVGGRERAGRARGGSLLGDDGTPRASASLAVHSPQPGEGRLGSRKEVGVTGGRAPHTAELAVDPDLSEMVHRAELERDGPAGPAGRQEKSLPVP